MEPPEYSSDTQLRLPSVRQMKRPSGAPTSYTKQRFVLPVLCFIGGMLVGMLGLFVAVLLGNADQSPVATPPASQSAALVVQISSTYVNQIAQQKANTYGIPGTVKNVHVTFVHNGPVTITGDDEMSLLGLHVTKHFHMDVQVYASGCKPMIHVLRVNFSGIPITGFASSFEKSTNQQLQGSITGLPEGFIYCMTAIHTEPQGPEVSFAAQPMSQ